MRALTVLSSPPYRRFWLALLASQLGGWIEATAFSWLVLEVTGSAESLGIVVALQFLPALFISIPAGILADRYPKPWILFWCFGAMMAISVLAGWLIFNQNISYNQILLLALLYGISSAVSDPARQSLAVELAGMEHYPQAIALNSMGFNLARLIGPAIAGIIIASLGLGWAFWIDAALFVPLLAVLLTLPQQGPIPAGPGNLLQQAIAGIKFVLGNLDIARTVILVAWISIFGLNFQTLVPGYARLQLGLEAQGFGGMMSALGVGALVAALVQTQRGAPKFNRIPLAALGLVAAHLGLALPLSPWGAGFCFAMAGYAMITTLISANTFIQMKVSNELRGRVIAVYSLALIGTGPLGAYLTGLGLEYLGARTTALALAILTSLVPLLNLIHLPPET